MKKIIIPIIAFIGICINVSAQEKLDKELSGNKNLVIYTPEKKTEEKSNKELRGDNNSFSYSFEKAINKYNRTDQLSLEGQRRLAESYHHVNKNIESEEIYSKLINLNGGTLPEDYYNYAMVLKDNGKYDESNKWMDKFNKVKPDDLRAMDYEANKDEFAKISKDDGKYKIEHMNINSDADDFGACYYKDKIVFASTKEVPKMIARKYSWTGKPFWDMYVSEVEKGQLTKPKNFNRTLNGKLHDGPASFSNNGTFMAFTRNNYDDKSKDRVVELQIYFSTNKDGKWLKPEPFIFNNTEYSVGQPCLSADGNTMYFTSDMPGGYGGADIYRVTRTDKGQWGKPENLGNKINTEGDEMFPFFQQNNEVLFFSSNGRFGLGGLDIFYCAVNGDKFGKVKNAGFPLNSQYDDFAVIVDEKMNKGYFSSNRPGGSGGDDIYAFDLLKLEIDKKIEGIAKDKNEAPISNTFVLLLDDKGFLIDSITTKKEGAYTFMVESDKNFKLVGKNKDYLDGETVTSTFGRGIIVKADVTLLQEEKPIAIKTVVPEKVKIEGLKTIYFDLDKFNIRPDAAVELDKIVKIMNDNPEMVVELSSYTDSRATMAYNQILSNNRAKASADYIKKRITKPERISGKGFGETNLVNKCAGEGNVVSTCSEEEHSKNRRSEFVIEKQ